MPAGAPVDGRARELVVARPFLLSPFVYDFLRHWRTSANLDCVTSPSVGTPNGEPSWMAVTSSVVVAVTVVVEMGHVEGPETES